VSHESFVPNKNSHSKTILKAQDKHQDITHVQAGTLGRSLEIGAKAEHFSDSKRRASSKRLHKAVDTTTRFPSEITLTRETGEYKKHPDCHHNQICMLVSEQACSF
jgi:hypothetical protein